MRRDLFVLLCVSVWINYLDRGNLSVAAPALAPEMGLSAMQTGVLLSAFFWTYSLLQPAAGWLVDRYDVYRLYGFAFALWSLAVFCGGIATGFYTLLLSRLALGIGESLAYPAYSRILAAGFGEQRRGFANAMIDAGTKGGPALGTLAGGLMVEQLGWRWFFILMGGLSLIWLAPWFRAIPSKAEARRHASGVAPGRILRLRKAWVTFLGLFCFNYAFYFLLTWLPSYLVGERGFTLRQMAIYGALPFGATAVTSVATGWWADRRIQAGAHAGNLRRRIAVVGLLACSVCLFVSTMMAMPYAMIWLAAGFTGIGLFTSCVWAITQTLAGERAAGSWTGWQNAVGNMGGVAAPVITGWTVSLTGNFSAAFAAASVMLLLAAAFYGLLLGDVEPEADLVAGLANSNRSTGPGQLTSA